MKKTKVAILGGGNIGQAIARGLIISKKYRSDEIIITRRNLSALKSIEMNGFRVTTNNRLAVKDAKLVFLSVTPNEIIGLLEEIKNTLSPSQHVLISVVTGVMIADIARIINKKMPILRAMPNTAIELGESMTCISYNDQAAKYLNEIIGIFDCMGKTKIIPETEMIGATVLCACGVAFFLRAIRAAAQGGIEIGFHPEDAIYMAAQTALGAAKLLFNSQKHPEQEIDRVTTPRGCTIAGLNQMEHEGFSSAIIKGIKTSAEIAGRLFPSHQKD